MFMHRNIRNCALTLPLLFAACENHAYRTDESATASPLVGRCFVMRSEFHVYPSKAFADHDTRHNKKDSVTSSFEYDGHFGVWPGKADYGIDVPVGSRIVVEKVLATHYPYPKQVTYLVPYVRLDVARKSLLVEASRLFVGLDQQLPRPVPDFLGDCE